MNQANTAGAKPKVLGIIPARFDSKRLPGKMLADLNGKTLIRRTYERSKEAVLLDALVIATDSDEIEEELRPHGAQVLRSVAEYQNGTERACGAVEQFTEFKPDAVAIIWGDEPMYPASVIDACVDMFIKSKTFDVVTAAFKIYDLQAVISDSVGKVVTDMHNKMLYLSRAPIPYNFTNAPTVDYYHSSGVMVMSPEFLKIYSALERTPNEIIEGVEQLRILENGYNMGVVKSDAENIGINTPDDYTRVARVYAERDVQATK